MRRFYSRESDKRGLSSSISFKTLGIWTRDASEGATHGDRRFCFRFSGKRCDTRGSHGKSGKGSMGRMEQIGMKGYSEPFL